MPAFDALERCDLAVAVTAVLLCQSDERKPKRVLVPRSSFVLQGAAGKANDLAGSPLGRGQLLTGVYDGLTKIVRRQALGFR